MRPLRIALAARVRTAGRSLLDRCGPLFRARLKRAWHHALPRVLELTLMVVVGLYLTAYVSRFHVMQGDLRTYIAAAKAALAGVDPYAPETLDVVAGRHVMPFVYPPAALVPFVPLALMPSQAAMLGYMWAKAIVLAILLLHWWRRYLPQTSLVALVLVALYGANRSFQWDLASGNLATIETALLFAGFACWRRGWHRAFAAIVVAAAIFKLAPAAFLLLLMVPMEMGRARPRLLATSLIALASIVALPMFIGPASHWTFFLAHSPDATLFGDSNPGSLGFFTTASLRVGLPMGTALWTGRVAWALFATALAIASVRHLRSPLRERDRSAAIMITVLLYVVLHPRVMAYGYFLATPAMLYFRPRPFAGRIGGLLWALVLSAQGLMLQLTSNYSSSMLVTYAPFLLASSVLVLELTSPPTVDTASAAPVRAAA